MAVEQVGEAVEIVRDEDGDLLRTRRESNLPVKVHLRGERREYLAELGGVARPFCLELNTHEEEAESGVLMLVGV